MDASTATSLFVHSLGRISGYNRIYQDIMWRLELTNKSIKAEEPFGPQNRIENRADWKHPAVFLQHTFRLLGVFASFIVKFETASSGWTDMRKGCVGHGCMSEWAYPDVSYINYWSIFFHDFQKQRKDVNTAHTVSLTGDVWELQSRNTTAINVSNKDEDKIEAQKCIFVE